MKLGYLGIDQYGDRYKMDKHPRQELLEQLGRKHCDKMYCDPDARHVGYIIARRWINVYEVHSWSPAS